MRYDNVFRQYGSNRRINAREVGSTGYVFGVDAVYRDVNSSKVVLRVNEGRKIIFRGIAAEIGNADLTNTGKTLVRGLEIQSKKTHIGSTPPGAVCHLNAYLS